ncbi:hypothetical protein ACFWAY_44335 [Rhodococcus sp. NPDC059968]|uniref:hypothetical protein n=1 Tax=Rhodococcus sp. NPDC059968 TaxID=3347017 RepID=UPI00366C8D7D
MSDPVTRQWAARDAVLTWLYIKSAEGNRHPTLNEDDIARTAGWDDGALEKREVQQASSWLLKAGLLAGREGFGSGVSRPSITTQGEYLADRGVSVRDAFEQPNGSGNVTINNTGHGNFAVNSPAAHQSNTVTTTELEKAVAIAEALEKAASEPEVTAEAATEAREIAGQIREAASQPDVDRSGLRRLAMKAGGSLVTAFSSAAASEVGPLALEAAQALMS